MKGEEGAGEEVVEVEMEEDGIVEEVVVADEVVEAVVWMVEEAGMTKVVKEVKGMVVVATEMVEVAKKTVKEAVVRMAEMGAKGTAEVVMEKVEGAKGSVEGAERMVEVVVVVRRTNEVVEWLEMAKVEEVVE